MANIGLYTSNAKQYLKLLVLFGVLSQPIYWWALPFIVAAGWFVEYGMEGVAVMIAIGYTVASIRDRDLAHPLTLLGGLVIIWLACYINTGGYGLSDMLGNDYAPWVILAFALGFITLHPPIEEFEKRFRWPGFRLFFYAYYPGHLATLGLIGLLIFGVAGAG